MRTNFTAVPVQAESRVLVKAASASVRHELPKHRRVTRGGGNSSARRAFRAVGTGDQSKSELEHGQVSAGAVRGRLPRLVANHFESEKRNVEAGVSAAGAHSNHARPESTSKAGAALISFATAKNEQGLTVELRDRVTPKHPQGESPVEALSAQAVAGNRRSFHVARGVRIANIAKRRVSAVPNLILAAWKPCAG